MVAQGAGRRAGGKPTPSPDGRRGVRRRQSMLPLLAVTLLVPTFVAPWASAAPSDTTGGARLVETIELSPRLRELVIDSEALGRTTRTRILLPASFGATDRRYPVLYLLHGMNGDYTRWTTDLPTEATTEPYEVIVVMPDGDPAGFYSNWYNGGAYGPPAWETYHLEELRVLLEEQFRANGRYAIAGHSMGGFGALSYASRHPDVFSAVIAASPASDTRYLEPATPAILTGVTRAGGKAPDALWGSFNGDEVRWRTHNPLDLAPNLRQTPIYVSIGNGVPGPLDSATNPTLALMTVLEGALHLMNLGYLDRLDALGIAPAASDLGRAGSHIIEYAHEALARWLPDVMAVVEQDPVDRSRSFAYRSAEDHFSVWGWTFDLDRPAPAFVDVAVSGDTISVNGTGLLRVLTPAHYEPGGSYQLQVAGGDPWEVVADDLGRLGFDLDLAGTSSETYSALFDPPGPRHGLPPVTATITTSGPPAEPSPTRSEPGANPTDHETSAGRARLPATGSTTPTAPIALLVVLAIGARMLSVTRARD